MHQQRLGRVADAHPLALAVDQNLLGHVEIGRRVDVHVAVAGEMFDDGHLGLGRHAANQPLAAARNRQVDVLRQRQKLAHRVAVGRAHQLHGVRRQADFLGRLGEQLDDRLARMDRFLAAAQDHRVARLDADRRRVGRHVGPRFVDEKHDAQRHADLVDPQTVRADRRPDQFADRLRQRRDFFQPLGHRLDPRRREPQPIDLGVGQPVAGRGREVLRVGRLQPLRHSRATASADRRSHLTFTSPLVVAIRATPAGRATPRRCSTWRDQNRRRWPWHNRDRECERSRFAASTMGRTL